jgi:hypothetical protein
VWFKVDGAPIRDAASAQYGVRWIEKLTAMAEASPGWRSEQEWSEVRYQFLQARGVYERLRAEAGGSTP